VEVINPKSLAPTVASGPWNCGWLNVLKASARNSPCIPSRNLDSGNSLKSDVSMFLAPVLKGAGNRSERPLFLEVNL
jgi:hypothetical protein